MEDVFNVNLHWVKDFSFLGLVFDLSEESTNTILKFKKTKVVKINELK